MADKTWVSTNGDLTDAASWNPTGSPSADDNMFFGPQSQHDLVSNLTGFTATSLGTVWFMPGFAGALGGPGNNIEFASNAQVICQGTRDAYFTKGGLRFVWDSFATLNAGGNMGNTFVARKGLCLFSDGARTGGILALSPHPSGATPTVKVVGTSGVTLLEVSVSGGTFSCEREITNLFLSGGRCIKTKDVITVARIYGGLLEYNSKENASNFSIHGGTVDFSGNPEAVNVTTMQVYPGGDFIDSGNVTFSALLDYRGDRPLFA